MIKNKILSKCEKCENNIKRCFFKQKFNNFYVEELYHIVESLYCIILFLFSDYMTLMTKLNIVKMKNGKISKIHCLKRKSHIILRKCKAPTVSSYCDTIFHYLLFSDYMNLMTKLNGWEKAWLKLFLFHYYPCLLV